MQTNCFWWNKKNKKTKKKTYERVLCNIDSMMMVEEAGRLAKVICRMNGWIRNIILLYKKFNNWHCIWHKSDALMSAITYQKQKIYQINQLTQKAVNSEKSPQNPNDPRLVCLRLMNCFNLSLKILIHKKKMFCKWKRRNKIKKKIIN